MINRRTVHLPGRICSAFPEYSTFSENILSQKASVFKWNVRNFQIKNKMKIFFKKLLTNTMGKVRMDL